MKIHTIITEPHTPIIFDWAHVDILRVEKQLDTLIEAYHKEVARLILKTHIIKSDFCTIEDMSDQMSQIFSPIRHLKAIDEPRIDKEVYGRCLEKMSRFSSEISQNEAWYAVHKAFFESEEFGTLTAEEKTALEIDVRDFELNGVALPLEKKNRCKEISALLTVLSTKFTENVLGSSSLENWSYFTTEVDDLAGLSADLIDDASKRAVSQNKEGYLFALDGSTFVEVMKNASSREVRKIFHRGWSTRASDCGTHPEFDNAANIAEILALKHEKALLLGFENHAQYQLSRRMAKTEEEVMSFLTGILEKSKIPLSEEMNELSSFAQERGVAQLEPWDIAYYSERLMEEKFTFSIEEVRQYFPAPTVISGMFEIVRRLYGISFVEQSVPLWHADAKYFDIYDEKDVLIGGIYMDLYGRTGTKSSGAWMDEAVGRRMLNNGSVQLPVGYLVCNFGAPLGNKPSLLTINEVETLLHEFGHNLQLFLTKGLVASVSGINNVPWDGVELASQFMENFFWQRESVNLLSGHFETGEKLPDELFTKVLRSRNFGYGYFVARQLSLAIFDFRLYSEYVSGETNAQKLYEEVQNQIFSMVTLSSYSRMPSSFSHIFGGGYSAGYYSYMWADLLAADAFSAFLNADGSINWSMGRVFLDELLSRGASRSFMESYEAFRGRKPNEDALMRKFGFMK